MLETPRMPVKILLVEDNIADARLTQESLKDCKISNALFVVRDGAEAVEFLDQAGKYHSVPRPDLILLDLNLPRRDGREVLSIIKSSPELKVIPVIVLSVSQAELDIAQCYKLRANCYIAKPLEIEEFTRVIREIERFWFSISLLPMNRRGDMLMDYPNRPKLPC